MLIGANPTDAHPVFASRMKKAPARRGQDHCRAIPAASIWSKRPHVQGRSPPALRPGTNVALMNAIGHVIVTEGLVDEAFVASAARTIPYAAGAPSLQRSATARKPWPRHRRAGRPARQAARLYATGGNGAIYYGLGVTEHSARARPW